jgi:putative PIN family toxin of toxin-antitoxin system
LRVVIDANVIISAAITDHSTSSKCIEAVIENHDLLMSTEALDEYRSVLERPKIQRVSTERKRMGLINLVRDSAIWIVKNVEITACRDPKDNHLLELAVTGGADILITGDRDLLDLNGQFTFAILSPRDFLNFLAS